MMLRKQTCTHRCSNRPEGLPWAQILRDLYQATKLNLDTVTSTDFGTFRAKHVYKDYNDSKYWSNIQHIH